ncbi:FAD-dependent oxidoreductase [Herbiconiux moechotypicola]|uniref:FAD-dependent oxidoreductase n=1 Tax=Herbiconiux moechotypicola TaxID=637393 RepID=A0ABP5R493_9MICO|nr:FAD-dependent oxidoreductase [Herbiconiux moechotypicola]MCS5731893.1 FAD-dependent oxidoreductase [Herbiconiux moechotypicola]
MDGTGTGGVNGMGVQSSGEWDVIVVGGGAAGVAAAIAAGRQGARTLLLERSGFVGGISATLPWLGFHDQDFQRVVRGLAGEFADTLAAEGHASPITLDPKCGSLVAVHPHYWKVLALRLLREAGVTVLLHALFVRAIVERVEDAGEGARGGVCTRVTGVEVESKSGRTRFDGRVVVDCSGDGDVAVSAGADWEKGRTGDGLVQSPTLVFRLGGIDDDAFRKACQDPSFAYREWFVPYPELFARLAERLDEVDVWVLGGFAGLVERARAAGDLDIPQSRIVGVKLSTPETPHEISVVMTRVLGLDPVDVGSMSEAYGRVYEQIPPIVRFFRDYVPGCADAYLVEIAPMLGVRESRRIVGDAVLTADDLVEGRRHPDDVAMGGYHIDIHRPSGTWVSSTNVRAYGIPLGALVARGMSGLLMAGKCLSATHEAVGSARVIPICLATGEAAGTAAALTALAGGSEVRDIDPSAVRRALLAAGAELGVRALEVHPDAEKWPRLPFDDAESERAAESATAAADAELLRETAWLAGA